MAKEHHSWQHAQRDSTKDNKESHNVTMRCIFSQSMKETTIWMVIVRTKLERSVPVICTPRGRFGHLRQDHFYTMLIGKLSHLAL